MSSIFDRKNKILYNPLYKEAIEMTLGEYIKAYRTRMGLSQRSFSQKCKVSHAYIGFLEKGVNPSTGKPINPTLVQLHNIAYAMGIRLDELLDAVDDMVVKLDTGDEVPGDRVQKVLKKEAEGTEFLLLQIYRELKPEGQQRLIEQATMLYGVYKKDGVMI
jgi:transcriptional regulator with XRE-family HTH domain